MDFEGSTIIKALREHGQAEFKAFKEAGGDETPRFEAKFYFEGQLAAYVANGGYGGPCDVAWIRTDDALVARAQAFIKAIPAEPCEHIEGGHPLAVDEDFFFLALVEYTMALKLLGGGKRTVFYARSKRHDVYSIKSPLDAKVRAHVLAKTPDAVFLNDVLLGAAKPAHAKPAHAKPAHAKPAHAKPTLAVVPPPAEPKKTVRALAEALLAQTAPAVLSYEDVIQHIKAAHPDAKTSVASLRWYESKMRAAGTTVPSRSKA